MKTISEKKSLEITIDYEDISDVSKIFDKIFSEIVGKRKSKNMFEKRTLGSAKYTFQITSFNSSDYREEFINGNWCQIFKSKMNLK